MKKIICIRGEANTGKTTTIIRVYNKLTNQVFVKGEINTTFAYGDLSIAIFSQGDPNTNVVAKLKRYIKKQSAIIICSARTGEEEEDKVYENEFLPYIQVQENILGYEHKIIDTEKYGKDEIDKHEEQYERLSSQIVEEIKKCINASKSM